MVGCLHGERKLTLSNSVFLSFSMQAGRPSATSINLIRSSHHVVLNFDHSTVKHVRQNIQYDCHQRLSRGFRVQCTKFVFGRASTPDPAGGAYSAPPGPLAGLRGPNSKGERKGGGKGREEEERRRDRDRRVGEGERMGRKGREEKGRKGRGKQGTAPLSQIPGSAPVVGCTTLMYSELGLARAYRDGQ